MSELRAHAHRQRHDNHARAMPVGGELVACEDCDEVIPIEIGSAKPIESCPECDGNEDDGPGSGYPAAILWVPTPGNPAPADPIYGGHGWGLYRVERRRHTVESAQSAPRRIRRPLGFRGALRVAPAAQAREAHAPTLGSASELRA